MLKSVSLFVLFSMMACSVLSNITNPSFTSNFDGYNEATLHFLDDTSIKGYAKILDFLGASNIKFKLSENGKPDTWDEQDVKGVTMHAELVDIMFHYIKTKHNVRPKLLEVIELGEISIYAQVDSVWRDYPNANNLSNSFDGQWYGGQSYRTVNYKLFVMKQDQIEAQCLEDAINFKKAAKEYFQNCPGILDKIDKREFKRRDTLEMVYYYNDYCAEL